MQHAEVSEDYDLGDLDGGEHSDQDARHDDVPADRGKRVAEARDERPRALVLAGQATGGRQPGISTIQGHRGPSDVQDHHGGRANGGARKAAQRLKHGPSPRSSGDSNHRRQPVRGVQGNLVREQELPDFLGADLLVHTALLPVVPS
jgi:hypothetical protein